MNHKNQTPQSYCFSNEQTALWELPVVWHELWAYCRVQILGPLDEGRLNKSLKKVIDRHAILSSSILMEPGPEVVSPQTRAEPEIKNLTPVISNECSLDECRRIMEDETQKQRRSNQGIFGCVLSRTADHHLFSLSVPSIYADRVSMKNLMQELWKSYDGRQGIDTHHEPVQYQDYSEIQAELADDDDYSSEHSEGLKFWERLDLPLYQTIRLPEEQGGFDKTYKQPAFISYDFTPSERRRLELLANKVNGSLRLILLAAWKLLLYRLSGQSEIRVESLWEQREFEDLETAIGLYTHWLPIPTQINEADRFRDLLTRLDLMDRKVGDYRKPLAGLPKQEGQSALDRVGFSYDCHNHLVIESADRSIQLDRITSETNVCKLHLCCLENEEVLSIQLCYSPAAFNRSTVESYLDYFREVVTQVTVSDERPVRQINLVNPETEAGGAMVECESNDPQLPFKPMHALIAEVAGNHGDAIAIETQNGFLTYRRLHEWSNQFSRYLRTECRISRGDRVAVMAERSERLIIAMLGILKAGAVYVPMAATLPKERRNYIIKDATVKLLLVDSKHQWQSDLPTVVLDHDLFPLNESIEDPDVLLQSNDLAYVIYTSGTTGQPKGVAVTHCGLPNLGRSLSDQFKLTVGSKVLMFFSVAFDGSIYEIFTTLVSGATLCIFERSLLMPGPEMISLVLNRQIDTMTVTPTVLSALDPSDFPTLKNVITAGEECSISLIQNWSRGKRFFNAYGPTEATVCTTIQDCRKLDEDAVSPPIGHPIDNVRVLILDSHLNQVPRGVAGEMYIDGVGLADRYLNRPDQTAERFIPHPFSRTPGARLYQSGDFGRYRKDGSIEFIGRMDQQVKLRGYRIELGEIVAQLERHPLVQKCAVTTVGEESNNEKLVAYIIKDRGTQDSGKDREKVLEWQNIFDIVLESEEQQTEIDDLWNIVGWKSVFTGESFPMDEMVDWVQQTVDTICTWSPKNILEIGCGTGLILFRLIDDCESYVGTDFSPQTISTTQDAVHRHGYASKVTLSHQGADDISGLQCAFYDTIIINSVAQYFPSHDYLMDVMEQLIPLAASNGKIFLGDLRNLPLMPRFYDSLAYSRLSSPRHKDKHLSRAEQFAKHEQELAIHPHLFYELKQRFPEISHVEIKPKSGRFENEMSIFHYDVIIHIHSEVNVADDIHWIDAESREIELSTIKEYLVDKKHRYLGLRNVANKRLQNEYAVKDWLESTEQTTFEDYQQKNSGKTPKRFYKTDDFLRLSDAVSYDCRLNWNQAREDGAFDVVFVDKVSELAGNPCVQWFPEPNIQEGERTNVPKATRTQDDWCETVQSYLKEKLPAYMIPSDYVVVESFPQTSSGKLDYAALPKPEYKAQPVQAGTILASRSPIEEIIHDVWLEILQFDESMGDHENFFELGGHSLLVTQVVSRLNRLFDISLTITEFFQSPTISSLSETIQNTKRKQPDKDQPTIGKRTDDSDIPLSFAQSRLWFINQMEPDNLFYNINFVLRFEGALDQEALKMAWETVVRRHEILRTTFPSVKGVPNQIVSEHIGEGLILEDLRELEAQLKDERLHNRIKEFENYCFNLATGPLYRTLLVQTEDDRFYGIIVLHHIIADGWSVGILIDEISKCYSAFSQGITPELTELPVQYADFSIWQNKMLTGNRLEQSSNYWKQQLKNSPPLIPLPLDFPRPAIQTFRGAVLRQVIPKSVSETMNRIARDNGVTLFMVLLSTYYMLLKKYTGQVDITIGSPIANRNYQEIEHLIGFFVNTMVLRLNFPGDPSFRDLIAEIKKLTLDAYDHQDIPFEKLVEELQPDRSLSHSPLFQVWFALQNAPVGKIDLQDISLGFDLTMNSTAKFDLSLSLLETSDGLIGEWEYNVDLFREDSIQQFADHYTSILEEIAQNCERRLSSFTVDNAAVLECAQWNQSNKTDQYDSETSIQALFEQRVLKSPDSVALIFKGQAITYRELNRRSNRLAHYLRSLGAGAEEMIGIFMERSPDMVISMLAVLKSGAAYIPLDAEMPAERIQYIVDDTNMSLMISTSTLRDQSDGVEGVTWVPLDSDGHRIRQFPGENPGEHDPDYLAYSIYTSGSTGTPKGVQIPQRAVINFLFGMMEHFPLTSDDRFLAVTTVSFDIAVLELFLPLISGCPMILAAADHSKNGEVLRNLIDDQSITHMQATPATWRLLVTAGWQGKPSFAALCGGEALSRELAVDLLQRGIQLHNLYGPTETTIWSMVSTVSSAKQAPAIGLPILCTQVYILDEYLNPVPPRATGELYIGGLGVARGYTGKPDLTALSFVPNPFSDEPGERLYKTGDMVRHMGDSSIEYIGRVDNQIKLRGFRIEPKEIERCINEIPYVQQSLVKPVENTGMEKSLSAYIIPDDSMLFPEPGLNHQSVDFVGQWEKIWNTTYAAPIPSDSTADTQNTVGWHDSYTGDNIPETEMTEWVDLTVSEILRYKPKRILEIGCGTGMLLFRLAEACEHYTATDVTENAIQYVSHVLCDKPYADNVRLLQKDALDLESVPLETCDFVILNSIVQYFPCIEYLTELLQRLASGLPHHAQIFIGDVRNLKLHRAFQASILCRQSPLQTDRESFEVMLDHRLKSEKELLIDPSYFNRLHRQLNRACEAAISLKEGRFENELNKFRYNVHLRLDAASDNEEPILHEQWNPNLSSAEAIKHLFEQSRSDAVIISKIPNARLWKENMIIDWLENKNTDESFSNLVKRLKKETPSNRPIGVDPYEVTKLIGSEYSTTMHWKNGYEDGSYDLLINRSPGNNSVMPYGMNDQDSVEPKAPEANNPLKGEIWRNMIPNIKNHLHLKLPQYMIPVHFIVLESFPLTFNRKINRHLLPNPSVYQRETTSEYVPPNSALEKVLVTIWEEFLGINRIGIHDNFFSLGGHSILIIRIASRIKELFDVDLPIHRFFKSDTIAAIAQELCEQETEADKIETTAALILQVSAMTPNEVEEMLTATSANENEIQE